MVFIIRILKPEAHQLFFCGGKIKIYLYPKKLRLPAKKIQWLSARYGLHTNKDRLGEPIIDGLWLELQPSNKLLPVLLQHQLQ